MEPGIDQPLEVGFVKTKQHRLAQGLRAGGGRGFHHPRQRDAHDVGCPILPAWPIGTSALEYALLCVDAGARPGEWLLREIEPRAELPRRLAPQPVDRRPPDRTRPRTDK